MRYFLLVIAIFTLGALCALRYQAYMAYSLEGDTWADTLKLVIDGVDKDLKRLRSYADEAWSSSPKAAQAPQDD
jgi:hypothetical protein